VTIVVPATSASGSLTLLQIIQSVCRRIGILAPNAVVTSTDPQVIQLLELSLEEGREQLSRYSWQALQKEATFTTVATQLQTTLAAITTGFEWIVNNTIWNRSLRRPVYGPDSEQDWQQSQAMQINGPFNRFRIISGAINFYPVPTAGQTCAFEYISNAWITTNLGVGSSTWTSDLDTTVLDEQLVILGTVWRWKAAKGLQYAEDFRKYEARLLDVMNRDGAKPTLTMTGAKYDVPPVVIVPAGSWN
jgi:hypothetical protein